MPAKKQGETVVLKHRLAGAAVLIAFAVIVLPMLLGGPGPAGEQAATEQGGASSESDTRVFRSNITPIGGATPNAQERGQGLQQNVSELMNEGGSGTADSPQQAEDDTAADRGAPPETSDEAPAATQAAADDDGGGETQPDEPEAAPEPRKVERGWIVQVGTFRKSSNVEKLVANLESSGFGPSTTDVETSAGMATRVWVGPFETRVEAARVKNRVAQKLGSEPLIVAWP